MRIFRTIDRMIAKATYDPELEKQLAEERKQAREARTKYRDGVNNLRTILSAQVKENKITPEGATLVKSLIQEAEKWLTDNPDVSADEIADKSAEYFNKVIEIYEDDKGRIYHLYFTTLWTTWISVWKANNMINEETSKKAQKIIDEEKVWYKKHLKESTDTYVQRINSMVESLKEVLPPDMNKNVQEKMKEKPETQEEIDKLKAQAEQAKRDREAAERRKFNPARIVTKTVSGLTTGLIIAVVLAFALLGASIASNEAIVRPVSIRVVSWIYGFIFFIPVILYAAVKYFYGKPPYFGAYLIPLYMYDPTTTEKKSFIEKLVWYKDDSVLRHAMRTFQEAAEAVKG